jgi:hypothetical protein
MLVTRDMFSYAEDFGPDHPFNVPSAQLKAFVEVENVAAGPAMGATRKAPDETKRLRKIIGCWH